LFFICIQDSLKPILEKIADKKIRVHCLSEIEKEDPEFARTKDDRSEKEYAWTSKAPIILYLFNHYRRIKHMVYMDADTCFLSSPKAIFDEFKKYSVMLTRERFFIEDNFERYRLNGSYNGGFLAFRRDKFAIECLKWFREKCLDWCYNRLENGLYGDQKYLDEIPQRFNNVGISKNMGVNVTAWYAHASILEEAGNKIYLNDFPVIFYHFSGSVLYNECEFDLCMYVNLPGELIQMIYVPYVKQLHDRVGHIGGFSESFHKSFIYDLKSLNIRNYFRLKGC
jgi:lipopolysaccharide biosynthesis glycosyltransferase